MTQPLNIFDDPESLLEFLNSNAPGNEDDHYSGEIQPTDYIAAQNLNFFAGNIVKYVTRYGKKGGVQDLEKALWYLLKLIIREKQEEQAFAEETARERKNRKKREQRKKAKRELSIFDVQFPGVTQSPTSPNIS